MVSDQIELTGMFKKHSYDEMKGLLETWMETGQVGDTDEEESTPVQETPTSSQNTSATPSAKVANVKDAFDDLFNN